MKIEPPDSGNDAGKDKKLVLLVDDETDLAQTFAWLFEWNGFEVICASDGRQALQVFGERMPDILISDCMMPAMGGVELSQRIRKEDTTRGIPIILMSAAPAQNDLVHADYDVFLQKPVQFDTLLAEVNRLLEA